MNNLVYTPVLQQKDAACTTTYMSYRVQKYDSHLGASVVVGISCQWFCCSPSVVTMPLRARKVRVRGSLLLPVLGIAGGAERVVRLELVCCAAIPLVASGTPRIGRFLALKCVDQMLY